jgi:hypothetical protein
MSLDRQSEISADVWSTPDADGIQDNTTGGVRTTSGLLTSTAKSISPPVNADTASDLVSLLWIYSGPIIFVIGLCGNVLILVVMTRRRMSGTSTSVHLSLMALADMAVLCTGLVPEWIEAATGVVPKEVHPAACKLEKFLFYTRYVRTLDVMLRDCRR